MSKFKVGDVVEVVSGWGRDFQVLGTGCVVTGFAVDGTVGVRRKDTGVSGGCYPSCIKLVSHPKQKPPRTYTEQERRIAAADVRKKREALDRAIKKAEQAGIRFSGTTTTLSMSYQPPTPPVRNY